MNAILKLFVIMLLAGNLSVPKASHSLFGKDHEIQSAVPADLKPRSRYLLANGIRIHYLEWGTGHPTIVLLHGLYDSSNVWLAVAPLLAKNYRVIAPDRRGAGLSDRPLAGYDYQTLARDVESLIVVLKLRRAVLVAHSAAGDVAVTLAASAPDKVSKLVLVDGGFWPRREESSTAKDLAPVAPPECTEDLVECRRKEAIERAARDYDPDKLYARVSAPVLLVLGVPPEAEAKALAVELNDAREHVESVARKLRNGQMAVIEGTSHWIQRDRPKELAMAIEKFLKI